MPQWITIFRTDHLGNYVCVFDYTMDNEHIDLHFAKDWYAVTDWDAQKIEGGRGGLISKSIDPPPPNTHKPLPGYNTCFVSKFPGPRKNKKNNAPHVL